MSPREEFSKLPKHSSISKQKNKKKKHFQRTAWKRKIAANLKKLNGLTHVSTRSQKGFLPPAKFNILLIAFKTVYTVFVLCCVQSGYSTQELWGIWHFLWSLCACVYVDNLPVLWPNCLSFCVRVVHACMRIECVVPVLFTFHIL